MDAIRIILSWLATILLLTAPFVAKRRGNQFWQAGLIWKYPLYFFGVLIMQAVLIFMFGAIVGVIGSDPGYDVLYSALAAFALSEIVVVSWLISRKL